MSPTVGELGKLTVKAPPEVLGKYCELDAYWALQIYKKCLTVVEESGQTELLNLEHSLTKVLYDM